MSTSSVNENGTGSGDNGRGATYEIADDFSLEGLHERLQKFVDHPNHPGLVLSVAGGGGHLLSSLASTPGASQVLMQASITYDRESYRRYIQEASDVSLEDPSFRYASPEASKYAASASLKEALEISAAANTTYGKPPPIPSLLLFLFVTVLGLSQVFPRRAMIISLTSFRFEHHGAVLSGHEALHNIRRAVGVGIASALKSPHTRSKTSRAFVTAETSTGQTWQLSAQLAKSDRTRVQEDIAVAHIALTLLECVQSNSSPIPLGEQKSTRAGDQWTINRFRPDYTVPTEITRESIRDGVQRILEQGEESILLLPFQTPDGVAFRCIRRTVLPPHSIVFPGSFNPVHEGHVELAKAAMEETDSKMAFFEISITNADKPALSLDEVTKRLEKFLDIPTLHEEENASILSHCRWGVLMTNAPLFKQKVDILQPLHVSRTDNQPKPLPFVIGTDTLVRLVNPKYYNDSYEQMVAALEGMACNFVVGGRLEQKKVDDGIRPVFVSGEDEIEKLPDSIRSKFTALTDFRVDISSSEIRKKTSSGSE